METSVHILDVSDDLHVNCHGMDVMGDQVSNRFKPQCLCQPEKVEILSEHEINQRFLQLWKEKGEMIMYRSFVSRYPSCALWYDQIGGSIPPAEEVEIVTSEMSDSPVSVSSCVRAETDSNGHAHGNESSTEHTQCSNSESEHLYGCIQKTEHLCEELSSVQVYSDTYNYEQLYVDSSDKDNLYCTARDTEIHISNSEGCCHSYSENNKHMQSEINNFDSAHDSGFIKEHVDPSISNKEQKYCYSDYSNQEHLHCNDRPSQEQSHSSASGRPSQEQSHSNANGRPSQEHSYSSANMSSQEQSHSSTNDKPSQEHSHRDANNKQMLCRAGTIPYLLLALGNRTQAALGVSDVKDNQHGSSVVEDDQHYNSLVENNPHGNIVVEDDQHYNSLVEDNPHGNSVVEDDQHYNSLVENNPHGNSVVEDDQHYNSVVEDNPHGNSVVEDDQHYNSLVENNPHGNSVVEDDQHYNSLVENNPHGNSVVEDDQHYNSVVEDNMFSNCNVKSSIWGKEDVYGNVMKCAVCCVPHLDKHICMSSYECHTSSDRQKQGVCSQSDHRMPFVLVDSFSFFNSESRETTTKHSETLSAHVQTDTSSADILCLPLEAIRGTHFDLSSVPVASLEVEKSGIASPASQTALVDIVLDEHFNPEYELDMPAFFCGEHGSNMPASLPGEHGCNMPASFCGEHGYNMPASLPGEHSYNMPASLPGEHGCNKPASLPGEHGYNMPASLPGEHGWNMPASLPGEHGCNKPASLPGEHGYNMPASLPGEHGYNMPASSPGEHSYNMQASLHGEHDYNISASLHREHGCNIPASLHREHGCNIPASLHMKHSYTSGSIPDHTYTYTHAIMSSGDSDCQDCFAVDGQDSADEYGQEELIARLREAHEDLRIQVFSYVKETFCQWQRSNPHVEFDISSLDEDLVAGVNNGVEMEVMNLVFVDEL